MLGIDGIKAVFTYVIATILIVGGMIFLYMSRLDPPESNTGALIPLVSGFVGSAVTFVFQQETQTRTARQVERSITTGVEQNAAATVAANVASSNLS